MPKMTNAAPRLKPGDVVQIRPPAEILASLDAAGSIDALPFMPEMLTFIGQRFTVAKRVEKICDTVGPGGSRRMRDTVFLENLRCDGSAHGGCQAECRLYWKEAWLVRADAAAPGGTDRDQPALAALDRLTRANTQPPSRRGVASDFFKCQATEASRATQPIPSGLSPGQYIREFAAGNAGAGRLLGVLLRAAWWKIGVRLGFNIGARLQVPHAGTTAGQLAGEGRLRLQEGDWVEVRSAEEIGRTLTARNSNRGLRFSPPEMLPACGRRFRVRRRIERLVDEHTGRLLTIKNDCIVLEGFVCTGERSPGRWFCAREVYPYWREAWLKRVASPSPSAAETPAPAQLAEQPG